ncbi:MAG: LysR family transcriptional regulator [Acidobacteria bacterium]|nr:MAG: LysR family transcriptional regulator [Acidobacteriota bacterium]
MHLRYLRCFIAVAEERSFTRAAERLHTVQPSLSRQIKRLEDLVGTPLFDRDQHHVELTEAGRVFLVRARDILGRMDVAIHEARQAARAETGHLAIGFVPGAEAKVFPHVLPALKDVCPGIRLSLRSLTSPEQMTALRSGTIDVGFLRPPVEDESLVSEAVVHDDIVAVLPAGSALASMERIPVARLTDLPLVQVARENAPAVHELANQIAAAAGVSFRQGLVTDNVLGTLNAVGAGLGFSLLPDYVRPIAPPTVAIRPLALDPPPGLDLVVAFRAGDNAPALGAFLRLLREWIALRA